MTTSQTRYAYDTETNVKIVAMWCSGCGVPYGLAKSFIAARREDHRTWTCPNGCVRHYPPGSSEAEQLQEKLDAARALAERESRRRVLAEEGARAAEYQRRAAKGQVTRIKNRVAKGVCPCCNRTFANLAAHMAGQHPDYAAPAGE